MSLGPLTIPATRPPHLPYKVHDFVAFPIRAFTPPTVPNGRIYFPLKSCGLTPHLEVDLADVLADKHPPPLSLQMFHEYLTFVERKAQSLHFLLWLEQYTRRFSSLAPTVSAISPLVHSFDQARAIFLSASSPLRIIVPADLLAPLATLHQPHPDQLAPLRQHVENELQTSLNRFATICYRSSGTVRCYTGVAVSSSIWFTGWIPTIVNVLGKGGAVAKGWRIYAGFPMWWFGIWAFLVTLQGLCLGVFFFGFARQYYSWELTRPYAIPPRPFLPLSLPTFHFPTSDKILRRASTTSRRGSSNPPRPLPLRPLPPLPLSPPPISAPPPSHLSADDNHTDLDCEVEIFGPFPADVDIDPRTLVPGTSTASRSSLPPTPRIVLPPQPSLTFAAPTPPAGPHTPLADPESLLFPGSRRPSLATAEMGTDAIDALLSRDVPADPMAVPLFAPLTPIRSPLVIRAQWEIVVRSAVAAALGASVCAGISYSLPHGSA